MTYYRLRDIKTPPFAYVLNKDEAVDACSLCQMPYDELAAPLEVEICATDSQEWTSRILGKPMMADHWLIGDQAFADTLEDILPGAFERQSIKVVSWMARSPMAMFAEPEDLFKARPHPDQPAYYHFKPARSIALASDLIASFPPITCPACQRDIPEIPIDFQPAPDPEGASHPVAALQGLHLEGYDYLFRHEIAAVLERRFPEMILEKLVPEPLAI